ncbi:MAG: hypothetical protein NZ874_01600 [Fimbriimonadales bacterium]|nr:hypothetical protein [Fimbriimonadales bacterium]
MARTVVSVHEGLDTTVQATLCLGEMPKPLRGTGKMPVQVARTVVSVHEGLDKNVQATVCLGETPKPRFRYIGEMTT